MFSLIELAIGEYDEHLFSSVPNSHTSYILYPHTPSSLYPLLLEMSVTRTNSLFLINRYYCIYCEWRGAPTSLHYHVSKHSRPSSVNGGAEASWMEWKWNHHYRHITAAVPLKALLLNEPLLLGAGPCHALEIALAWWCGQGRSSSTKLGFHTDML